MARLNGDRLVLALELGVPDTREDGRHPGSAQVQQAGLENPGVARPCASVPVAPLRVCSHASSRMGDSRMAGSASSTGSPRSRTEEFDPELSRVGNTGKSRRRPLRKKDANRVDTV